MDVAPFIQAHLSMWGRKGHFYVVRTLGVIAVAVGALLAGLVTALTTGTTTAMVGGQVFITFAVAQFVILMICAVILGASTVAREREEGTLSVLLTTHASPRSIVIGLAAGRWVPLAVGLVGGLPIAMLLAALGGITPLGIVLSYVLTLAATFAALGFTTFLSAFSDRSVKVLLASVLLLASYLVFVPLLGGFFYGIGREILLWLSPLTSILLVAQPEPDVPVLLLRAALWVALGGGFLLASAIPTGWVDLPGLGPAAAASDGTEASGVPGLAGSPGSSGASGAAGAAAKSRAAGPLRALARRERQPRDFGDRPYYEMERARARGRLWTLVFWTTVAGVALLEIISFLPGMFTPMLRQVAAGICGFILTITVVVNAATAFTEDRRRRHLELILASPLTAGSILWSKAGAIAWRVAPLIALSLATSIIPLLLDDLTGGLPMPPIAAIPLSIAQTAITMAFLISLGMWISLRARSPAWAVVGTFGAYFGWSIGLQIVIGIAMIPVFMGTMGSGASFTGIVVVLVSILPILITAGATVVIARVFLLRRFDRAVGRIPSRSFLVGGKIRSEIR